jgi:Carboxypeptidase regulatory-like domain
MAIDRIKQTSRPSRRSSSGSRILRTALAAWALTAVACAPPVSRATALPGGDAEQRQQTGVLAGQVTRGPLSPVERPGVAGRAVVPGAKVIVSTPDGQDIASATTDAQGLYSINLPPGTYRVMMTPPAGLGFSKDVPATVSIADGRETRLELLIDSGIR